MKEIEFGSVIFYVGQNCLENDKLFMSMSENSLWFHLDSQSSSHVYCVVKENKKLSKEEMRTIIKKGGELVRIWSKKTGKVMYIKKCKLKRVGPGIVEILEDPKYT